MSFPLAIYDSPDNSNDIYSQLTALLALELNDNNPNTTEIINDYLINNPNAFPPLNNYINTSVNTTFLIPSATPPSDTPSATTPPDTPPNLNMMASINNYISSIPIDDNNDYFSDSSSDDSYFDDIPELLSDDDLYDSEGTVCAYPSVAPYPWTTYIYSSPIFAVFNILFLYKKNFWLAVKRHNKKDTKPLFMAYWFHESTRSDHWDTPNFVGVGFEPTTSCYMCFD